MNLMNNEYFLNLLNSLTNNKVVIRSKSTYDWKIPKGKYSELKKQVEQDKIELQNTAQDIYKQGKEKYYYISLRDEENKK